MDTCYFLGPLLVNSLLFFLRQYPLSVHVDTVRCPHLLMNIIKWFGSIIILGHNNWFSDQPGKSESIQPQQWDEILGLLEDSLKITYLRMKVTQKNPDQGDKEVIPMQLDPIMPEANTGK